MHSRLGDFHNTKQKCAGTRMNITHQIWPGITQTYYKSLDSTPSGVSGDQDNKYRWTQTTSNNSNEHGHVNSIDRNIVAITELMALPIKFNAFILVRPPTHLPYNTSQLINLIIRYYLEFPSHLLRFVFRFVANSRPPDSAYRFYFAKMV